MILTRSFITSYLVVYNSQSNIDLLKRYDDEIETLKTYSKFIAMKPNNVTNGNTSELINTENLSFDKMAIVEEIVNEYCIDDNLKGSYIGLIKSKCIKINDRNEFEEKVRKVITDLRLAGEDIE